MAPAIALTVQQSPEAAIILDNLNMLETRRADILAFRRRNLDELWIRLFVFLYHTRLATMQSRWTICDFALRGGIYNRVEPAVGELNAIGAKPCRCARLQTHIMNHVMLHISQRTSNNFTSKDKLKCTVHFPISETYQQELSVFCL